MQREITRCSLTKNKSLQSSESFYLFKVYIATSKELPIYEEGEREKKRESERERDSEEKKLDYCCCCFLLQPTGQIPTAFKSILQDKLAFWSL